jgi:hypothetical protein
MYAHLSDARTHSLLVRHRDRLAEMRDSFLERRAAERLIARSSPPFNRKVVEPGLREMMGDDFRLSCCPLWIVAQQFTRAPVQRLPAALEQAIVGGVLDQGVLEALGRLRRRALDEQKVGIGEPVQRRLQRGLV